MKPFDFFWIDHHRFLPAPSIAIIDCLLDGCVPPPPPHKRSGSKIYTPAITDISRQQKYPNFGLLQLV